MTYKTQNTQNLRGAFSNYQKSGCSNLYGLYNSFSYAKARAWTYCEDLCHKFNGYDLKAISGNTFNFSAGFVFQNEQGQEVFCYITKTKNSFLII